MESTTTNNIENTESFSNRVTSRKLILFILVFIVATGLLVGHRINGDTWAQVVNWCFLFYASSNIGEKLVLKR